MLWEDNEDYFHVRRGRFLALDGVLASSSGADDFAYLKNRLTELCALARQTNRILILPATWHLSRRLQAWELVELASLERLGVGWREATYLANPRLKVDADATFVSLKLTERGASVVDVTGGGARYDAAFTVKIRGPPTYASSSTFLCMIDACRDAAVLFVDVDAQRGLAVAPLRTPFETRSITDEAGGSPGSPSVRPPDILRLQAPREEEGGAGGGRLRVRRSPTRVERPELQSARRRENSTGRLPRRPERGKAEAGRRHAQEDAATRREAAQSRGNGARAAGRSAFLKTTRGWHTRFIIEGRRGKHANQRSLLYNSAPTPTPSPAFGFWEPAMSTALTAQEVNYLPSAPCAPPFPLSLPLHDFLLVLW